MPITLAIVGRPNVGKSTLFNRLAGKRLAIVHDLPGVTRDRRMADGQIGNLELKLIDTAGLEDGDPGVLTARMREQTLKAVEDADACVFLVDARAGVTTGDEIVAQLLRRAGKPVILAANKCEGRTVHLGISEAYRLGFGEPIALSAEHGTGLTELLDALLPLVEEETVDEVESDETDEPDENKPLRLAIVGRPNVGKSSLLNQLIGEERVLTGPDAGTTRDSIAVEWEADGRPILLHDTAGLRKRARAAGHELEQLSIASTLDAVKFADCVVVVIDATIPFEQQDLKIADLIAKEGRAVVFAANKWDLVENPGGAIAILREKLDRLLPQVTGAALVAISARTGEGIERILPAVLEADHAWNKRVSTAAINRFLSDALERHPPPAIHGRRVRIRYMTQAKSRPPTFALFGNQLTALPESYLRYLQNELRKAFDFFGVPIRLHLRNSKNPFSN